MLQRISSLLFGEPEDLPKGPKPSVQEADEEGWMLVCMPEGTTITEASSLDDVLIDLPSLAVYGSHGDQGNTEEGMASLVSLTSSVRAVKPAPPVARSGVPGKVVRVSAPKAGALTKVTQVGRVQRAQTRAEWCPLGRKRAQRQNAVRERTPRRASHAHRNYLHQPGLRTCNH
ncbi:hypothetical protein AGOR_G00151700 [Albula goreensis]|uniref:Tumor protein p53-inducible nuclear protein 2 n=1 Tax=Albula goreensis TaxID=1534307 RepID=A0A8T3D2J9_9TELE|nr:hypothetical protein AGOR_G00151700 [Albula goreensis]